jgi:hypothetical protein
MNKNLYRNSWTLTSLLISLGLSQIMNPKISWIPLALNLLIIILYFYVFKFHKRNEIMTDKNDLSQN